MIFQRVYGAPPFSPTINGPPRLMYVQCEKIPCSSLREQVQSMYYSAQSSCATT